MSLNYARSRGWNTHSDRNTSQAGIVILSDGSTRSLSGYVDVRLSVGNEVVSKHFYILEDLTYDVLLGDHTLDQLDLWNKHANSFVDIKHDQSAEFHNIQWRERFNKIEREVDFMISGASMSSNTQQSPLTRLSDFSKSSFFRVRLLRTRSREMMSKGELMKHELWQRLYEADTIGRRST
jgi:hypothetical protein